MQITFTGQESSFTKTAKGGYSTMVVSYVDEKGANKSWKLISFANPKVFDTFKVAKPNEVYEITTRKNDKDFTEWASADVVGTAVTSGGHAAPAASTNSRSTPVVSQYETRDERNARQRYIIRQSSISNAIAMLTPGSKTALDLAAVATLADALVAYVFEAPELSPKSDVPFQDMEDDIPY